MKNQIEKIPNYDIFISYKHKTGFYMAQILYTKLTADGYSVFMDKTMDSGRFEDKIRSAVAYSRNFLIVLFPEDLKECENPDSWLNKEAAWALQNPQITIIPVMCDGFSWSKTSENLTDVMKSVSKNNGIVVHKDYSLDSDLDKLCNEYLKNVSHIKTKINSVEFFKYNLEYRTDYTPCGVDVAFHAGAPWLMPGEKYELLMSSLKRNIRWRVLINSVDAAESIGKHMRDENALYVSFEQVQAHWAKLSRLFPDCLEVRRCDIPLIHVYHSVNFKSDEGDRTHAELHIKYYAYNNTRLDNAFEHEVSSYSKHYEIYKDEFEFLWNKSEKI